MPFKYTDTRALLYDEFRNGNDNEYNVLNMVIKNRKSFMNINNHIVGPVDGVC